MVFYRPCNPDALEYIPTLKNNNKNNKTNKNVNDNANNNLSSVSDEYSDVDDDDGGRVGDIDRHGGRAPQGQRSNAKSNVGGDGWGAEAAGDVVREVRFVLRR